MVAFTRALLYIRQLSILLLDATESPLRIGWAVSLFALLSLIYVIGSSQGGRKVSVSAITFHIDVVDADKCPHACVGLARAHSHHIHRRYSGLAPHPVSTWPGSTWPSLLLLSLSANSQQIGFDRSLLRPSSQALECFYLLHSSRFATCPLVEGTVLNENFF
jgi:hypothetical protein